MFYHLFYPLHTNISFFNIFKYITFRTIYGSLTAFLICILLGPIFIRKLKQLQIGQYVREEGPKSHFDKAGTPTMGGVMILFSIVVSTLLWADLTNFYILIMLVITVSYGGIGFIDDYLMQVKKQSKGLTATRKFIYQIVIAFVVGYMVYQHTTFSIHLTIPFFRDLSPD